MLEDVEHSELDRLGVLFPESLQILTISFCEIIFLQKLDPPVGPTLIITFCKV